MGISAITIINWIQVVFLFIASYFGAVTLVWFYSKKHRKDIMRIKRTVLTLIAAGTIALAIGFTIQNIMGYAKITAADFFFVIGYALLALGFNHLWYMTAKMHKMHVKDPVFIFGVVCGVFIWLYYLFVLSIIPQSITQALPIRALSFYYPIIVSLIFMFTLVVHPRLKAGVIHTPLWYISNGVFMHFIGFMMYTYSLWNITEAPLHEISSVLLMISAFYFALEL